MKKRYLFLIPVFGTLGLFFVQDIQYINNAKRFLAGVFFVDSVSEKQLKNDYISAKNGGRKIKILVVPGHDKDYWGAEFKGLKEADLNLELAKNLVTFLKQEKEFEVILGRDENGYKSELASYFSKNRKEIENFIQKNVAITNSYIQSGLVEPYTKGVPHNVAPEEVAFRLYGINKWANENKIDIVIHIHLNDDPERTYYGFGKYTGFAIYIPEKQFSNAKGSMALAKPIFNQLQKYLAVSDLPKEKNGIIEDQKLIAIGAYNTLDAAGLLIEYGYIYEPQFVNAQIRPLAIKESAFQTYSGIKKFFEGENASVDVSANLPYIWKSDLEKGVKGSKEVFALQIALILKNVYPPENFSKNDCPLNGNFGDCTAMAVKEVQKENGIEPASGFVGPVTRKKLNELSVE